MPSRKDTLRAAAACALLAWAGWLHAAEGVTAQQVLVDASAVKVFDSSALAVLLACRRAALEAGKQLVVEGLPKGLKSMAVLYGVDGLLIPPAAAGGEASAQQG